MKTPFLLIYLIFLIMSSCSSGKYNKINERKSENKNKQESEIKFQIIENYFIRNDAKIVDFIKIESPEKFNQIFGVARTMSNFSKLRDIDFTKEYIIAMMLPETHYETNIYPVSVKKNDENKIILTFNYKIKEKRQFTVIPFFAIVIDRINNSEFVFVKSN